MNEYELEVAREQQRLERELLAENEHLWPLVFTVFLLAGGRIRIVR